MRAFAPPSSRRFFEIFVGEPRPTCNVRARENRFAAARNHAHGARPPPHPSHMQVPPRVSGQCSSCGDAQPTRPPRRCPAAPSRNPHLGPAAAPAPTAPAPRAASRKSAATPASTAVSGKSAWSRQPAKNQASPASAAPFRGQEPARDGETGSGSCIVITTSKNPLQELFYLSGYPTRPPARPF